MTFKFIIDDDQKTKTTPNKTQYVNRAGTYLCACSGVTLDEFNGKHKLRVRFVVLADNNTDNPMTGHEIHENLYLTERAVDRILLLRDAVDHTGSFDVADPVEAFNVFSKKPVLITVTIEQSNQGNDFPKVTYSGFAPFQGEWSEAWSGIIEAAEKRAEIAAKFKGQKFNSTPKMSTSSANSYNEVPF